MDVLKWGLVGDGLKGHSFQFSFCVCEGLSDDSRLPITGVLCR